MAFLSNRWLRRGVLGAAIILVLALAIGSLGTKKNSSAPGPEMKALGGRVSQGATQGSAGLPVMAPLAPATGAGTGPSGGADASGNVADVGAAQLPPLGDRIARTADLTLEIKKGRFETAWSTAFRTAQQFGGQIMSATRGTPQPQPVPLAEESAGKAGPSSGDITMRVPADKFAAAANALRTLGTVRSETTSTEDVTQEYVDLQSRLRNARAEQTVLLSLFDRARTIRDILAVQGQLSDVQGQIEQITGRIRFLDTRTTFSTITLRLAEKGAVVFPTAPAEGPSFGRAWHTTVVGLVRIGTAAMITAMWLLPFAVLALLGMLVWRRTRAPAPQA
jgi:uncharacterized protein DUF4349